ncbi:MAG: 16S rRNA (adenine(1518)-N(6)/adenine(1519)-N(6))-dimethyltransferase RsmA [Planctomycetaceae bacterium]|jgi:16S rRNA (adenine1518-N6/adenine1519-N6)-dimethyltransferase|nr:16S rRNA (adenine(1518)-N(6)/adenine(1519)-N(6))-dimethyltransferase RsmA [Planctomycetaceae bacterium]MDG2387891.1 16S rRNA (adenine(1518)-N(6)/adenine(1519)-N(6))-dimethyltransferase RsmA [Planctomycetaceae bacterium]
MKDADRQTRSYLMELFEQRGVHPRSDYGQNFLIDINLIEFAVESAELTDDDVVLEIGAGTGGMTAFLAQRAGHVVSVEIDTNVVPLAEYAVREFDNVTLLNIDALKNKNNFAPEVLEIIREKLDLIPGSTLKLVANLPYNVATPIISNLVATDLPWSRMVTTIQWELAARMASKHGGGTNYGALSVWLQSQADIKILKKLKPTVFWPRPKVDSAIVRLIPNPEKAALIEDREFFHDFVRRLFHHRRKMMRSVLVTMYRKQLGKGEVDRILGEAELDLKSRAEALTVEHLVELSNRFAREVKAAEEARKAE